jgi:hypothetical protein
MIDRRSGGKYTMKQRAAVWWDMALDSIKRGIEIPRSFSRPLKGTSDYFFILTRR